VQQSAAGLPGAVTGSDTAAVEQLIGLGGDHLRRCYQCGTCSVVCPRTPLDNAFPRKEMVWAQWGLTDRLAADADAWLCVQCNECTVHCPVDARPGDLMAALRNLQISHYAVPHFMVRAAQDPRYLPLAFVPSLIAVLALVGLGIGVGGGHFIPSGPVRFAKMVSDGWVDLVTFALLVAVGTGAVISGRRFWHAIGVSNEGGPGWEGSGAVRPFWPALGAAVREILSHKDFKDCESNHQRAYAHMAILYGFLFLVIDTTGAFFYTEVFRWVGIHWHNNRLSLPLWDPIKIIGNLGFALLLGGGIWATVQRIRGDESTGSSTYFDWFFIALLYAVVLTGFGLMTLRLIGAREVAYPFYLVHLVVIFAFFSYFPYSKFAHVMYRTLAKTRAKQLAREPGRDTGVVPAGS
jgi:quinone-modifying oxidoreductase subunit QmoC